MTKWVKNAAGRMVPTEINGEKQIPFKGVGVHRPSGRRYGPPLPCADDYPNDGDKRVATLKEALKKSGIKDGMTISTHHHLRDGDLMAIEIFKAAKELGVQDLVWYPSASFPCHQVLIEYLEDETINRIEGSMNGPLGRFCSHGKMKGVGVLRSHGGRYQAVQDGEVIIDIAVIAAPTADPFGNANGLYGPSACGGLGYAQADAMFGHKVIVVTDNLERFPCIPMQIEGNYVDYVVEVERIGIPERIVSGTTQITKSPDRLLIADLTTQFCEAAGLIKDQGSFQFGAGGTALAIGANFHRILKERNLKARVAFGGTTKYSSAMLEDGVLEHLLDGQAFDLDAVRSLRENANHNNVGLFNAYAHHSKGNFLRMVDVLLLGATEVDVNFNANVVTHSDGLLLHGIGGWQNCLFAKCTILPIPLFRDRIPIITDEVTTLCGPGELIDVIVTERGIAINPKRVDLIEKVSKTNLPIKTIQELKAESERICGTIKKPEFEDEVVAVVKWVDGTVIDAIRKVKE